MAYGSGNCPECGVKFNVLESSIGTVKRCAACGAKFIVRETPVQQRSAGRGCSCFSVLGAVCVAISLVLIVACGGMALVGNSLPHEPKGKPAQHRKEVAQQPPTPPAKESTGASKAIEAPFKIEPLCGMTIDEVRTALGAPRDADIEPSKLQKQLDFNEWSNVFEKGGETLLVTFDPRNRRIIDFFVDGDDASGIKRKWGLDDSCPNYRLEIVKVIRGAGIAGIKVIPLKTKSADVARNEVPAVPMEAPDDKPPEGNTAFRIWTAKNGKSTTEATFGGKSGEIVTLHKKDGTTIKIKVEQLSALDQEWIESRRK